MAHDIRIVTEADLRGAMDLDLGTVEVIEHAFAKLSEGGVVMPPVMSMELAEAHGEVDVKTAYVPGLDGFAIKVSPGFFDNPNLGLPSLNGLMILFSARTGLVEAVFLDNGYLTDLRTAAAGAVAARHLAPEVIETAGVIGTGVQARLQARAAHLVRPYDRLLVWGRDADKARACAEDLARDLDCDVQVADHAEGLVRDSQLVITATPASQPVIEAAWLHPGLHITAMGSDQAGKNEIAPEALIRADLYVADRAAQAESLGELRSAIAAGLWDRGAPLELGDVVRGVATGRRSAEAITICDLTGTGVQDTAIAMHVMQRLAGRDVGTVIRA
jgi:ornithine cyclodeaminase